MTPKQSPSIATRDIYRGWINGWDLTTPAQVLLLFSFFFLIVFGLFDFIFIFYLWGWGPTPTVHFDGEGLLHLTRQLQNFRQVNVIIPIQRLPFKLVQKRGYPKGNRGQPESLSRADPAARPKRGESKIRTEYRYIGVSSHSREPIGLKFEWVWPHVRVPGDGPHIDHGCSPSWHVMPINGCISCSQSSPREEWTRRVQPDNLFHHRGEVLHGRDIRLGDSAWLSDDPVELVVDSWLDVGVEHQPREYPLDQNRHCISPPKYHFLEQNKS